MVDRRIPAEGLHFLVEFLRTGFWLCILGWFLKTDVFKKHWYYSGFCMCHILKDEDEDTYVIHAFPQVGRGGDHIYLPLVVYFSLRARQLSLWLVNK